MDQDPVVDKERWLAGQQKRLSMVNAMSGAFLLVSFAGTMEILGAGNTDGPLYVALFFFAVSLPLNCLVVYASLHEIIFVKMADTSKHRVVTLNAFLPTLGLLCIFWHFSWCFALSFLVSIVASFIILARWGKEYIRTPDREVETMRIAEPTQKEP